MRARSRPPTASASRFLMPDRALVIEAVSVEAVGARRAPLDGAAACDGAGAIAPSRAARVRTC